MHDLVDPELLNGLQAFLATMGTELDDIPRKRAILAGMVEVLKGQVPEVPGVTVEDRFIPGSAQSPRLGIRLYRPARSGRLPVLLWIHAGGYVMGNIEQDDLLARQITLATQSAVVAVDYRLAPEHPYPAPLEDCYAALKWIYQNAGEAGFDPARIAIGGASAGGGLAAGLALLARDHGEVPVRFQLLIYPMIDDGNIAPASADSPDTLLWTRENNLIGWRAYLGREPGSADVPLYASPARATELYGLPPAYIAVGELDLFLQENIDYANRLLQAGVSTELHVYPGAYHGFDVIAPEAEVSRRFGVDRDQAIKRAFLT